MYVRTVGGCALGLCLLVSVAGALEGPPSPGLLLWQRGQEAMRGGDVAKALDCYEKSLELDPALARNHLSLAAGHVALGEDARAALDLEHYLAAVPNHHIVRGHYAELLLRLRRSPEARAQFERFVADIQADEQLADKHLVHCHSRLMELAEAAEDEYAEHLHRGIGLFLLARQRARLEEVESELSVESLLCKAAGELTLARRQRPGEARPCWYLHEVWSQLAQTQPALRNLRAAESAAPFSELTPTEQVHLEIACRRLRPDGRSK
jgi:tetratricopeptide (TPR) repeat protein